MKTQELNTNSTPKFKRNEFEKFFREDAHQLFFWGYQDVIHKLHFDMKETQITLEIYEAIKKRLKSFELPEEIANRNYHAKAEDPHKLGDEKVFLDIVIENKHYIEYTFEAKRLRKKKLNKDGFSIGSYCKEGVMRFVNQRYSSDYLEAAMVAFMQSDDMTYWSNQLNQKFTKDKKKEFYIEIGLKHCTVIPDIKNEWVSIHKRSKSENITLFHIFLECY